MWRIILQNIFLKRHSSVQRQTHSWKFFDLSKRQNHARENFQASQKNFL